MNIYFKLPRERKKGQYLSPAYVEPGEIDKNNNCVSEKNLNLLTLTSQQQMKIHHPFKSLR